MSEPAPTHRKRKVGLIIAYVLSLATIPHVLLHKKRPAATLAWVWSIIAFPFVGPLAYWAVGADSMQRKRLRKAKRLGLMSHPGQRNLQGQLEELSPRKTELLRSLGQINQISASTARRVSLLVNAEEFYPLLLQAIDNARHHVHVEFFIWQDDPYGHEFLNALVRAARRGVEVRLLLDQIGCFGVPNSCFEPLKQAGGLFSWFYSLPLWRHSRFMNLRNHRKLQIIDGTVAFVGGMNMGRDYAGMNKELGAWRDAQLLVEGNVVRYLQRLFAEDWFFATNERLSGGCYPRPEPAEPYVVQAIAGGPDLPREPIPKSILALLGAARSRVWISAGYFVPNHLFLTGLQLCASRGVDVRLLVSEKTDHPYLLRIGRSHYEELLEWGVRVFEYSAAINHKKAVLLDHDWLMVGSANSDNRSMRLNFELNLLAHAPQEAKRLERVFMEEFAVSREIEMADVKGRSFGKKLLEAALRPLAPLL